MNCKKKTNLLFYLKKKTQTPLSTTIKFKKKRLRRRNDDGDDDKQTGEIKMDSFVCLCFVFLACGTIVALSVCFVKIKNKKKNLPIPLLSLSF